MRWAQAQVQRGVIERYSVVPASLEDVYVELVGDERRGAPVEEVAA